jgi:long-chain fatty acid transport protein
LAGLALALAFSGAAQVSATGFFINQQGVRGLGRVGAGNTVAADDLETIFHNPAGLFRVVREQPDPDRIRFDVGFHLIIPRSSQLNRSSFASTPATAGALVPIRGGDAHNPTPPSPVPNFYAARAVLDGRGAFGVGVNFPFGLTTSFDPDWHGRYDAIKASLTTINFSVVGAYRFESGVSVGGGLDLQHARSLLSTAIPDPLAPGGPAPASDGSIETKGHDLVTPGYNLGIIYEVDERTRVGAHYRSGMTHRIEGRSEIQGLHGPLASSNGRVDATAELSLPSIAAVGVRRTLGSGLVLLGDFQWFNWSTFEEIRIRFADGRPDGVRPANYRDAYGIAAGAEYPTSRWTARGGVRYDTTPTVDAFRDTTVPDSERLWLGLGTTFQVFNRLEMDLAFNHVFFNETSIALTRRFFDNTPLSTTVDVNSDVTSVVNTLAIDFRFRY